MTEKKTLESEAGFRIFLGELFEITTAMFKELGEIRPVAHVAMRVNPETGEKFEKPGIITALCPSLESEREKDMWVAAIRDLCSRSNAVAVVVANEAWMVAAERDEVDDNGHMKVRPVDHPNRIEVVTMMVEHASFGSEMWTARIIRDGDEAHLGEFSKGPGDIRGRFTQFIPQRAMN